jgi:hypothetical protein
MEVRCLLVGLVLLGACGGDEDAPSGPYIRGKVVQSAAFEGASALGNFMNADAVWVLPVNGGSVDSGSFQNRVELPLESDGTFTYTPGDQGNYDSVLALVNTAACANAQPRGEWTESDLDARLECVQGFVTIPDGDASSLMRLPTGSLRSGAELGDVSPTTRSEAASDSSLDEVASSFALDLETLRNMAHADDTLKSFAYRYANYSDDLGSFYNMHILFNWRDDLAAVTGVTDPANFVTQGYYVAFDSNVDVSEVSSEGTGLFYLYPPASVETDTSQEPFDEENPLELFHEFDQDRLASSAGLFTGVSPLGEWKLRRGGTDGPVVSKYDLTLGGPFREVNGQLDTESPQVFIPRVFADIDGDRNITGVTVSFFVHDGTNYIEVPNDLVQSMTGSASIYIGLTDGLGCQQSGEFVSMESLTGSTWLPNESYALVSTDQDPCAVSNIGVSYFMMDTLYQFFWHDGSI